MKAAAALWDGECTLHRWIGQSLLKSLAAVAARCHKQAADSTRAAVWSLFCVRRLGEKIILNGHPELRLPNTLNVNFVGKVGADLLQQIPEIAASTGSACHEGRISLSPVLTAMGVVPEIGKGAVRLTVGRFTTEQEIDRAAELLIRAAKK